MEHKQFEEAVERMLAAGAQRLTPGDVAFRLHLPVKDTERALDRLVTEGKLELDSDDSGNLFYFKPGSAAGGVFSGTSELGPAPQPLHPDASAPQQSWQRPTQAMPANPGWPQGGPPPMPPQNGWGQGPGFAPNPYAAPPQAYPPNPYAPPPQAYAPNPYAPHPQAYPPNPYAPPAGPFPPAPPFQANPYAPNPYPPAGYAQPPWPGQVPPNAALQPFSTGSERKSPTAAAILSAFFPGAGQLYNGSIGKGMGIFFSTFVLATTIIGLPIAGLIYLYGVMDAYHDARRQNAQALLPP